VESCRIDTGQPVSCIPARRLNGSCEITGSVYHLERSECYVHGRTVATGANARSAYTTNSPYPSTTLADDDTGLRRRPLECVQGVRSEIPIPQVSGASALSEISAELRPCNRTARHHRAFWERFGRHAVFSGVVKHSYPWAKSLVTLEWRKQAVRGSR